MDCNTPGFPVLHCLLEFAETHVHWVCDAIQPSHPLLAPSPPALNFPSIRVFSSELALCIRWPKYWSFSFSVSPSNEYSGLISFRIDWFDHLAVQGTLKSFLQYHSSKASILQVVNLLYSSILTSVHDYWKKSQLWLYRPLLAKQCLCFLICCLGLPLFSFQGASAS